MQDDYITTSFGEEDNNIKLVNPASAVLNRAKSKSDMNNKSETPVKMVKGRMSLEKVSRRRAEMERVSEFDNIKFWAGSGKVRTSNEVSEEFRD